MARKRTKVSHERDSAEDAATQSARPSQRKWRGLMQEIPNLPIDMLHEIFQHLTPPDLLSLSRTNKEFRSFILRKNAVGIWRGARQNIEGLPDCPSYMSEPAYANLMFSPHCHRCLTGNIQNIIVPFSVRYCNNCKKSLCVESYLLGGRGGYDGGLTADMFCTIPGERRKVLYHGPDVEGIWEEWRALTDEQAREEFKQRHRERVVEVMAHASQCAKFIEDRKSSRAAELKAEKGKKLDQVVERLRALGWGPELDDMKAGGYYSIREHASVRQLKKVNDKTWAEAQGPLTLLMKECKTNRLTMVKRRQIKERLTILANILREHFPAMRTTLSDFQPDFVDFAAMPEIRRIADAPSSKMITAEDFAPIKEKLLEMVDDWESCIRMQLCQAVTSPAYALSTKRPLEIQLASTLFDCTSCSRRGMHYPGVLAHECTRSRYYRGLDTKDSAYLYFDTAYSMSNIRPWSCSSIVRSPLSDRAKILIEACGEDPDQVRPMDDNLEAARLCCKTCSREDVKLVMSWRAALDHWRSTHSRIDQDEAEWEKVSDAEAKVVMRVEDTLSEKTAEHHVSNVQWSCARCPVARWSFRMTHSVALEHCRVTHHLAAPSMSNGDIYMSGDSQLIFSKPVLLVSAKLSKLTKSCLTPTERKYCKEGGGTLFDFDKANQATSSLAETSLLP
ncbi:hypothetical protein EIP91_007096 [Steccherinum ochraceum]|uniref:F-box domain-containing protein n=1 Tax=Steccherinum ochraceum TaxID=92696 RepID=A0A4R0R4N1_9APHY|nr:hypothetical protein EIP91_007096 [Steccherinum ochraceum]